MHPSPPRLTYIRRSLWILFSLTTLYAADLAQYPDNFRNWVHVETAVLMPGANPRLASEEGMHHIFANQKAIDGYASGNFADGSIIVYELREAQQKNGVIIEGERRRVDLMIKDASLYSSTGGWRFERFWGNGQTQDALHGSGTTCFDCHAKAKAHGFVFSQLR
jgi:Cytochrome P460